MNLCYCGVIAAARCNGCGEWRCASHYYISAQLGPRDYEVRASTPVKLVILDLSNFPMEARRAFVGSGGAECERCRFAHAKDSAKGSLDELRSKVEDFKHEPHEGTFDELREQIRDSKKQREYAPEIAGAIGSLLDRRGAEFEICQARLSPTSRFNLMARGGLALTEIAREPAVRFRGAYFTRAGKAFRQHNGNDYSGQQPFAAVRPGAKIQLRSYHNEYGRLENEVEPIGDLSMWLIL